MLEAFCRSKNIHWKIGMEKFFVANTYNISPNHIGLNKFLYGIIHIHPNTLKFFSVLADEQRYLNNQLQQTK